MKELVVIALGGNAIKQAGEEGTAAQQFANIEIASKEIVNLSQAGYKLVVTHGNGPQAGNLLIQQEEGKDLVPALPLNVIGGMTQGQIGYMFQNRLQNNFSLADKSVPVVSLVTQVLVDKDDPDFQDPSKPVGPFYSEAEANTLKKDKGYVVKEAKPGVEKGWRRVVPSPEPIDIVEKDAIKALIASGAVTIACGGGGIPVKKDGKQIIGIEGVIDKDKTGDVLAQSVGADVLMILTDVEHALINYNKPNQSAVGSVTVAQMQKLFDEGHFLGGSMGPKVEAAMRFVKATGKKAIITSLDKAGEALAGKTGTIISA